MANYYYINYIYVRLYMSKEIRQKNNDLHQIFFNNNFASDYKNKLKLSSILNQTLNFIPNSFFIFLCIIKIVFR